MLRGLYKFKFCQKLFLKHPNAHCGTELIKFELMSSFFCRKKEVMSKDEDDTRKIFKRLPKFVSVARVLTPGMNIQQINPQKKDHPI